MPVEEHPTFTALVPHYRKNMLLSIKEAINISEEEGETKVTQMYYLKELHPNGWESFINERNQLQETLDGALMDHAGNYDKMNEGAQIAFEFEGFNTPDPANTSRTPCGLLRGLRLYTGLSRAL